MKRIHINVTVSDLEKSVLFYSALFASAPTTRKDDYAKWRLEDPRVNFAISTHGSESGINHLGVEVDSPGELDEVFDRLSRAEGAVLDEGDTTCCYAHSTKRWINDPQGIAWETFFTHGEAAVYGADREQRDQTAMATGCCG